MKREFNVDANIGKPQVAYREAIKNAVEVEGKFVKQSGGKGQYGHVWLKLEPQDHDLVALVSAIHDHIDPYRQIA